MNELSPDQKIQLRFETVKGDSTSSSTIRMKRPAIQFGSDRAFVLL